MIGRVLVTGANGFIGRALCSRLVESRYAVTAAVRATVDNPAPDLSASDLAEVPVGEIGAETDWTRALIDVGVVVHLAGRAHVLRETAADPASLFHSVNRDGTLRLAKVAAEAGVCRFVFVSSIGVNGNETNGEPFSELHEAAPHDLYAMSKYEAEVGLREIGSATGMEIVILRPPLVYGPDAPGNFRRLLKLVDSGLPLPLGAIRNRRSLLYLGNLVDAICLCLEHPDAAGQTFLLDDGEPVSTPDLIRALAHALGRPARLLAVPVRVLELAGPLLGKSGAVARLTGSLYVDSSAIRSRLGWTPPHALAQGLAATVADWQDNRASGSVVE